MRQIKLTILALISSALMALSSSAFADFVTNSTVGAGGYDLVSYQTGKKPIPGNGNFVATVDEVNYLFASEENLKTFNNDRARYLPQYGGYCAFGVTVNKKFIGDPNVWEVVDGKLYFNLDNSIKSLWVKDIPGNIKTANKNWKSIKNVAASEL